jgi:poly(3-hydroxybutyrate) depolymerase
LIRLSTFLLIVIVLAACGEQPVPDEATVSYNVDPSRISVSGLSSGAHMATQLHVAHSELFVGAAILAGGPYYCAEGSLSKGIGPCIKGGDVGVDNLLTYAREMAEAGKIDNLSNLADDSVWVFHGALDNVVSADMTDATAAFYSQLISPNAVTSVKDIEVVHGLPTLETGVACDLFSTPFINACEYDAAGELLKSIHGELNERTTASGELTVVAQVGGEDAEMLAQGFLYVPASCAQGASCGVHVAIHGCTQSSEFVGDTFAAGSGLNEWAESNDLLVLYPQVASSKIAPMNPYGCWDWWGYTNEDYATRSGLQIAVIKNMLDALAGTTL